MNIGFIGAGNMAQAIIGGMLKSNVVTKDSLRAADISAATRKRVQDLFCINVTQDNTAIATWADAIVLAVKPQVLAGVIREISAFVTEETLVISIAAGKTLSWIEAAFAHPIHLVRVMPNAAALIEAGVSGLCANEAVTEDERSLATTICDSFGTSYWMPEALVEVIGVIAGCTPAFVALFIEALSDAAVAEGMPRAQATDIAARAVAGSARLVADTGMHPAQLKDMVTSPGGSTIEGIRALEEDGMRAAVLHAVRAATEKTKNL